MRARAQAAAGKEKKRQLKHVTRGGVEGGGAAAEVHRVVRAVREHGQRTSAPGGLRRGAGWMRAARAQAEARGRGGSCVAIASGVEAGGRAAKIPASPRPQPSSTAVRSRRRRAEALPRRNQQSARAAPACVFVGERWGLAVRGRGRPAPRDPPRRWKRNTKSRVETRAALRAAVPMPGVVSEGHSLVREPVVLVVGCGAPAEEQDGLRVGLELHALDLGRLVARRALAVPHSR